MTCWMLVSREWLTIVTHMILRDVWVTSVSLLVHLFQNCRSSGLVYVLASINDVKQYLAQLNCRSLTVSIYQRRAGEYESQCTELAEYVADPTRENVVTGWWRERVPAYGIPLDSIRTVVSGWLPNITSLHVVLVDCIPTLWYWQMDSLVTSPTLFGEVYPDCFTDVHITFAYTSPPPPLSVSAPRGTFYPPRRSSDLLRFFDFTPVKRLVLREANADFVAFLSTKSPRLECIESTVAFGVEDLPPEVTVAAKVGDRLVFRQLAPTTEWGIAGSDIVVARPKETLSSVLKTDPPPPTPKADPSTPMAEEVDQSPLAPKKHKKPSFWRILRRVLRRHFV